MPISLKLPSVDSNPILLAETRTSKIKTFIQNLPQDDPLSAANDLIDELQIINSQQVNVANRLNALELYRAAGLEIYRRLLPLFSQSKLPISHHEQEYAKVSSQLWQEFALGYKSALVDLQNKILSINNVKNTALIVQRAVHAFSELALINHLAYFTPPASLWSELHQLYFIALQQSADLVPVEDENTSSKSSSVKQIYTQTLLLALANPQHLTNKDTLLANTYLAKMCVNAELRALGFIASPTGVFLVSLNSSKPPISFIKNKAVPDNATDILLITVDLARSIHEHIKHLKNNILPDENHIPKNALETHFVDLLQHLIKQFGKTPQRVFSRVKKNEGIELGIGINVTHHLITESQHQQENNNHFNIDQAKIESFRLSRWQILNVSAGGYALRKLNASVASAQIGDVVTIKDNQTNVCELAVLRWANLNELNQIDVGVELISPNVTAASIKSADSAIETQVLLLPELLSLKQAASIIVPTGLLQAGQSIQLIVNNKLTDLMVMHLIERTHSFERFQYCLILKT